MTCCGTQLTAALLRGGTPVRATVRSLDREGAVRAAVRPGHADDAGLQVVAAELTSDEGWAAALDGCAEVYHTASPMIQPQDPDEVVVPAWEGTVRVLRAAQDAGARRVVLTSSFAAVGYTPKPSAEYTEGGGLQLVVINPTFIPGPTLKGNDDHRNRREPARPRPAGGVTVRVDGSPGSSEMHRVWPAR